MAGYIGSKAVNLSTTGADINGDANIDGDLSFRDNDKIKLGAGSDLQIYHDSATGHSIITESGGGALQLRGENLILEHPTTGNNYLLGVDGASGYVKLYQNGSEKLATTSTGIDVTGTITADGFQTDSGNTSYNLLARNSSNVAAYIQNGGSGPVLEARSGNMSAGQGDLHLKVDNNGDISFYEDTGTTPKFFWDASAESLGIGTTSPASALHIDAADSATSGFRMKNTAGESVEFYYASSAADADFIINRTGSGAADIGLKHTGDVYFTSGNVGIGTTSPTTGTSSYYDDLVIKNDTSGTGAGITLQSNTTNGFSGLEFRKADGSEVAKIYTSNASGHLGFNVGSERMRIDSSGNVGIGTSSPSSTLAVETGGIASLSSYAGHIVVGPSSRTSSSGDYSGGILFDQANGVQASGKKGASITGFQDGSDVNSMGLTFNVHGTDGAANREEAMRIDSSGNVGIGTSSPSQALEVNTASGNAYMRVERANQTTGQVGLQIGGGTSSTDWFTYMPASSDDLAFFGNSQERMRINSSGNVGIGVVPESWYTGGSMRALQVGGNTGVMSLFGTRAIFASNYYLKSGTGADTYINTDEATQYYQEAGTHVWKYAPSGTADTTISWSEAMRIDSSGNLLVGKTSTSTTVAGIVLNDDGRLYATGEGGSGHQAARFTRLSNDGDIVTFYKDSATVGSIGNFSTNLYIGTPNNALVSFGTNRVYPANNDGSARDNAIDLGNTNARFDDIYATNGTIQTSDRNEKQDIAELSDAEQRVAVAAKGLLRKFRWRDAVAEKGNEARTHFGIIAQDLQAAFAAEGLDAGDYAMFISSTWTDEETGEERTRMGVRYSELLAFIIGAL